MHGIDEPPYLGACPGVVDPHLTPEPLGTSGELSPGPDHLRPEMPDERRELERRGYLPGKEVKERVDVVPNRKPDEPIPGGMGGQMDLGPLVDPPPMSNDAPLARFVDGPIFE